MRFRSIGFHNFRNLADSLVTTDLRHVVLVGNNGQGKTNFLEALYTLCYGSSFRAQNVKEMCRHGEREFSLSAVVQNDDGLNQRILFRFFDGKRDIRIDGKEIRDRRELIQNIPCIVFSHDDIEFVRGTPENRRRFFDQTMSLYNPLFFDDLRHYRMVLKQRNAAIKDNYVSLIPVYDEQLATLGIGIQKQRRQAVEDFNTLFGPLYTDVSKTSNEMHIAYKPSWGDCTSVEEAKEKLARTLERDFRMQTTASGVHRDQFVVMDGPVHFAASGSTGQMRLASLIFRIAQVESFRAKTGKDPILLVDDVLLELDVVKRGNFLERLGGYSQAFFTFLPEETYFSSFSAETHFTYLVEEGRFKSQ
jgi:DNA replication and repair protein RecF